MNRRSFLRAAAAAVAIAPLAPFLPKLVHTPGSTVYTPKYVYGRLRIEHVAWTRPPSAFVYAFEREINALVRDLQAETRRLGLVPASELDWMDADGQVLKQVDDGYEGTLYWYAVPA